jgi:Tol biopolymer transport system component
MILRLFIRLASLSLLATSLPLAALFALRPSTPEALLAAVRVQTGSASYPYEIFLRDLDSGRAWSIRRISSSIIAWSPDGEKLAYVNYLPYSADLWDYFLLDFTTGTHTRLLQSVHVSAPRWSPDSRWLLYHDGIAIQYADTEALSPDGFKFLSFGLPDPLWSPDSTRLYFRDAGGGLGYVSVDCLTGQATCVPTPVAAERPVDQLLGWMPDGLTMMVYADLESDSPALYGLDTESGVMRLMLNNPLPGTAPVWSPDGKVMAASLAARTSGLSEPIPGLYLFDTDTVERTLLWTGVAGQLGWSPSGDKLMFELVARVGNGHTVWTYNRSTGEVTQQSPDGVIEVSPQWVQYRGRPFAWWPMLALDGALLALAWLVGIRNQKGDTAAAPLSSRRARTAALLRPFAKCLQLRA